MKLLILIVLFLFIAIEASSEALNIRSYYHLRSVDNYDLNVIVGSVSPREPGVLRLGSRKKVNCNKKRYYTMKTIRSIEMDLELDFLIDSLKERFPRKLSSTEKKILRGIPLCEPYLSKIKVVSQLLRGHKYISYVNERPKGKVYQAFSDIKVSIKNLLKIDE